jgi:ATP-dependent Clp protease ATP-binding subunit ClpB
MRSDKLTTKYQMALADAQSLAVGRDHQFIEPVHVMAALLDQQGGGVRHLLTQANVNVNGLRSQLGVALDELPRVQGAGGDVQISNELGRVMNVMDKLAQERKDQYISSELFVLAALEAKGRVAELLKANAAERAARETAIEKMRGGAAVNAADADEQRQALEKYTIDLTERADSDV